MITTTIDLTLPLQFQNGRNKQLNRTKYTYIIMCFTLDTLKKVKHNHSMRKIQWNGWPWSKPMAKQTRSDVLFEQLSEEELILTLVSTLICFKL